MPRIAHILLAILGLTALAASWHAVSNYVGSLESVRSLELELTQVRRDLDDNARLFVYFRIHNRSQLPVRLNSYFFDILLNGERIGGSGSTWRQADPNIDLSLYARASTIENTLAPFESLDLEFPLHIFQLDEILANAQGPAGPTESLDWAVEAGFRLIHPHTRRERLLRLQAALQAAMQEPDP